MKIRADSICSNEISLALGLFINAKTAAIRMACSGAFPANPVFGVALYEGQVETRSHHGIQPTSI